MKLPPFKLERYFARHEFAVEHLLCCSDCESMTVGELLALEPDAREWFEQHWLGYTESAGAPSLRAEIARIYQTVEPEQVLVFSGAEEAIFLFAHALLGVGDHLIVHWPCYQSLAEVARSVGCQVSPWIAREETGWTLDPDELKFLIRPNTRAVIINTPHNPTGYLMSKPLWAEVNRITQAHGLVLFSDEVYRESEYASGDRLPAACDVNSIAVSLGVMSKTYGLAGLRIGWIATHNSELHRKIAALKDYTTICSSAPSEFLAGLALRHREKLAAHNVEIIKRNLKVLDRFFARYGDRFGWQRPNAGPIAFPRLLNGDVDAFCEQLVQQAGVLLLPGTVYDEDGRYRAHFRIGFGRKNMPAAVERLEAFLK